MTITRIIDGKQIEIALTSDEIWQAHREFEQGNDLDDVRDIAAELVEDEGLDPFTDDEIRDVVDDLRDHMDNDMYIWSSNDIREFVENRLLELRD